MLFSEPSEGPEFDEEAIRHADPPEDLRDHAVFPALRVDLRFRVIQPKRRGVSRRPEQFCPQLVSCELQHARLVLCANRGPADDHEGDRGANGHQSRPRRQDDDKRHAGRKAIPARAATAAPRPSAEDVEDGEARTEGYKVLVYVVRYFFFRLSKGSRTSKPGFPLRSSRRSQDSRAGAAVQRFFAFLSCSSLLSAQPGASNTAQRSPSGSPWWGYAIYVLAWVVALTNMRLFFSIGVPIPAVSTLIGSLIIVGVALLMRAQNLRRFRKLRRQ